MVEIDTWSKLDIFPLFLMPLSMPGQIYDANWIIYAQIEKKALATTWTCERFWDHIISKQFSIETNHKPLMTLLQVKILMIYYFKYNGSEYDVCTSTSQFFTYQVKILLLLVLFLDHLLVYLTKEIFSPRGWMPLYIK